MLDAVLAAGGILAAVAVAPDPADEVVVPGLAAATTALGLAVVWGAGVLAAMDVGRTHAPAWYDSAGVSFRSSLC